MEGTVTKREIVIEIADKTGLTQETVKKVVQETLDLISEKLVKGQRIELRNFGVFETKKFKSRIGRNPRKPECEVVIPTMRKVRFRASNKLAGKVASGE